MDLGAVQSIFTTLPVDIVAAVLFATMITVVTLRLGASLAIALSLSLIVSSALFSYIPNSFMIGGMLAGVTPFVAASMYSALVVLLTFVMYRTTSTLSDDSARPLFAIATGLATTVVVLSMWHVTPLQTFWSFNPVIQGAFGELYRLYWLIVAFIAFAFVKS
ncbi:MAG: hypothetical protein KBD06_00715 [Candidatus Pacebacteria bacterium]|nr:hypothetical protein [Candidatus Paceibacterota bacterium]